MKQSTKNNIIVFVFAYGAVSLVNDTIDAAKRICRSVKAYKKSETPADAEESSCESCSCKEQCDAFEEEDQEAGPESQAEE